MRVVKTKARLLDYKNGGVADFIFYIIPGNTGKDGRSWCGYISYDVISRAPNAAKLISSYINTKMFLCLSVCLFVHIFLGHFETDSDTLWHKVSFRPRMSSKTIKFQKKKFFAELLPFFYISLRFLCKFEERL